MTTTEVNGHEAPVWEEKNQTVMLLEAVLNLAKKKQISSVALVLIPTEGEFQITASGPAIDGLYAGAVALKKQLGKLVEVR